MFIKHAKNNIKKRDMFYADLAVIFDWTNYLKLAIKPDYFWGPLMCFYSGMHIKEATSIELGDIKEQDGVHFFRVTDAKTETGNRHVPIHSLRHTVITRLAARNVNNSTIYQLTGHIDQKSSHLDDLHPLPMVGIEAPISTSESISADSLTSLPLPCFERSTCNSKAVSKKN